MLFNAGNRLCFYLQKIPGSQYLKLGSFIGADRKWGTDSLQGFRKNLEQRRPSWEKDKITNQLVELLGSAQGNGEGEVVPKSTPAGPVDLEDGDPGGENNYPEEEAHS